MADHYRNSVGMEFIRVPAGEFLMGSPPDEFLRDNDEGPVHLVVISTPFWIGRCPVLQSEFENVMGRNPSHFSRSGKGAAEVQDTDTGRFPVESVSWDDAQQFCRRLTDMSAERHQGRRYRLPTEAEWEYACRAGTSTPFGTGNGTSFSTALCNCLPAVPFGEVAAASYPRRTVEVGLYPGNAWSILDMHGQVWEWCLDRYDPEHYRYARLVDPAGPPHGAARVLRGGAWRCYPAFCRSAQRSAAQADDRFYDTGFRVVSIVG